MDKTFPGKFESYVDYDGAQRLHTLLTELNLWHAVKSEAEDHYEFSNPSINSADVIHNMLAIVRMLSKPYTIHLDPSDGCNCTMALTAFKLIGCCYPSHDESSMYASHGKQWHFRDRKDVAKAKNLLVPVSDNTMFQRAQSAETKTLGKVFSPKEKAPEAKKGKGKGKLPKKAPKQKPAAKKPAASRQEVLQVGLVGEDFTNAVEFAVEVLENPDAVNVEHILHSCLEFALFGEVLMNDVKKPKEVIKFKAWWPLRKHCKMQLAIWHNKAPRKDDNDHQEGDAPLSDNNQEHLNSLLQLVESGKASKTMADIISNKNIPASIQAMRSTHQALQSLVKLLWSKSKICSVEFLTSMLDEKSFDICAKPLLEDVFTLMEALLPLDGFVKPVYLLQMAMQSHTDDDAAPQLETLLGFASSHPALKGLIDVFAKAGSLSVLDECCSMRIKYLGIVFDEILKIVQEKTSSQLKVKSSPMLQAISNARHVLMSNHYRDELATKDFALHTYESWIDFWYKCLSHLKEGQTISCDVVLDLSRERLGKTHQAMSKKVLEKELQEQLQFYSEHRDEALDMMDNFDEDTIHSCVVMFQCYI